MWHATLWCWRLLRTSRRASLSRRASGRKRGDFKMSVSVPAVAAAKLGHYEALRERGLSKLAFARLLGVSETTARRLLQLDHRSHMDTIEGALAKLDRRVTVHVESTIRAA